MAFIHMTSWDMIIRMNWQIVSLIERIQPPYVQVTAYKNTFFEVIVTENIISSNIQGKINSE